MVKPEDFKNYTPPPYEAKICHISELFERIVEEYRKDPRMVEGWHTLSWRAFNKAYGGARPGELTVLTADTGTGKSTFALNWAVEMMRVKRTPFLISLENHWGIMARMLASKLSGKKFTSLGDTDIGALKLVLENIDAYFLDDRGAKPLNYILKAIQYAAHEKKCGFIVLDHFDYLIRPEGNWESSYTVQKMVQALCEVAAKAEATILLIVHPSKLGQKGINVREVGMDELKGSSGLKQEAHNVLSLYRPDPSQPETIIRFQKIRDQEHGMWKGSFIRFTYNPVGLQYTETSLEPEWDRD